ncbi:hypothetical protein Btru_071515 [Bulinus truncatus]|nr:hypothetical protein Btru_071515 [Bulinus truncatus]
MESRSCLKAILDHSIFPDETKLLDELYELKKTGTKIIISNLRNLQSGDLELDFFSSMKDIRCRRAVGNDDIKFKESLKEYLESVPLNLKSNLKITLRDEPIPLSKQKRDSSIPPEAPTKTKKKKVINTLPDNKQSTSATTLTYQPMQEPTVNSSQGAAAELRHTDPNRRQSNTAVEAPSTSKLSNPSIDWNLLFGNLPLSEQQKIIGQYSPRNVNIEFNLKNN